MTRDKNTFVIVIRFSTVLAYDLKIDLITSEQNSVQIFLLFFFIHYINIFIFIRIVLKLLIN